VLLYHSYPRQTASNDDEFMLSSTFKFCF